MGSSYLVDMGSKALCFVMLFVRGWFVVDIHSIFAAEVLSDFLRQFTNIKGTRAYSEHVLFVFMWYQIALVALSMHFQLVFACPCGTM